MAEYSLAQIKAHPNYPFDNFLKDDVSFLMAELYWPELFKDIMQEAVSDWEPYGVPAARDGNPIFSVFSRASARAFRVIQKFNEDGKPRYPDATGAGAYYPVQPWMNHTFTLRGDEELLELVLFSDCSALAEDINRTFITSHCVKKQSADEMEKLIALYERRVGMAA